MADKEENHSDDEEQSRANGDEEKEGEKKGDKKDKPPKPPSKKTLIIIGIVVAVLLVGALLYYLHARHFESTDDAYTTGHVHEISARVAGTVETLNVDDNQKVKAGQTLVVLDQSEFNVALQRAGAQLAQAKAQVVQRRAAVDRAEADVQKAQSDYDRTTSLYNQDMKAVSKAEVDSVTAALQNANGGLASARAELTTADAGVATAEAAVKDADLQLSYTTVAAPVAGLIAKRTVETGKRIQPGQALMALVEPDVWVLANLKETQLAKVRVGQHVEVEVDAVPDHKFSAHVDSFQAGTGSSFALLPPDNATGNFTKIVQRVPVKIVFDEHELDGFEDRVVPGLSVIPKIDLRAKNDDAPRSTTR
ncbi:MAG: HlyD family secretion protein [Verrucomicrobiota bacterium]|nr:HlyD family secretion protein [Verrucomicrobiota bacterium]